MVKVVLPSDLEGWAGPDLQLIPLDSAGVFTAPLNVTESCCSNDQAICVSLRWGEPPEVTVPVVVLLCYHEVESRGGDLMMWTAG